MMSLNNINNVKKRETFSPPINRFCISFFPLPSLDETFTVVMTDEKAGTFFRKLEIDC